MIRGQQESKWLCLFLSASRRRYVPVYLEDGHQSDQVYSYLNELYKTAVASTPCQTKLKNVEQVPFYVLDVLFPEVRLPLVFFSFILYTISQTFGSGSQRLLSYSAGHYFCYSWSR